MLPPAHLFYILPPAPKSHFSVVACRKAACVFQVLFFCLSFFLGKGDLKFERPESDWFATVFYFSSTGVALLSFCCVLNVLLSISAGFIFF